MMFFTHFFALTFALSLLSAGAAAADVPKDERNLAREVKRLNDTAAKPDGEKAVVKRLVTEYKATDVQIRSLRDGRLGYGEIAVVLSLAQAMPGGASDTNIQKVLALRTGPPELAWGQVARQVDAKLGKTVSQVRKTANNANREIKNDHARAGKAPKGGQPEPKNAPQGAKTPDYQGEGRLLRQGGQAN